MLDECAVRTGGNFARGPDAGPHCSGNRFPSGGQPMIHVFATIQLQAGARETFLEEFRRIVPQVRAETGCLEYGAAVDLATDISSQDPVREQVVVIIEKWTDVAALKTHLAAPHMLEYRVRIKDMVSQVKLRILEPVA
jgi:quinol monooxygenase YgiN